MSSSNPISPDNASEASEDDEDIHIYTLNDLITRMALRNAGYDKEILNGGELDKKARKLLQAKTTRKRTLFRFWPRDPNGKPITKDNSCFGKHTNSGVQIWGATLSDLYRTYRIPSIKELVTVSSGSKLAEWMKKNGELDWAPDEIALAELEDEPVQVPPCDIADLVQPTEHKIALKFWGTPMPQTQEKKKKRKRKNKNAQRAKSVFDPASYPAPWPMVPFSYPTPTLETYIAIRRLPKKLIVHDPWGLLSVGRPPLDSGDSDYEGPERQPRQPTCWTDLPDITHEYELSLSPKGEARMKAEEDEAKESNTMDGFVILPSQESGPTEPPIYVEHPRSPPPEPIAEAHLYLSPKYALGDGNHSRVYHAEWEVPRSMLMRPTLCRTCIDEDVKQILAEEDGEDGSKKDPRWKEKSGLLTKVETVQKPGIATVVDRSDLEGPDSETAGFSGIYAIHPGKSHTTIKYEGDVRTINTRVPWLLPDDPYTKACSHRIGNKPYPGTAKVRVAAKLSYEHDTHLEEEAKNYQEFPQDLFQHWNGFNVVPPLHDPVPVGAVVPQFYGIYKPVPKQESHVTTSKPAEGVDESNEGDSDATESAAPGYLSPILLLEDCGVPVNPDDLNVDDLSECESLYYRFHQAGWTHGSVASRNILVQPGPLSLPPFYRRFGVPEERQERSFRLIDFGRSESRARTHWGAASVEEMAVGRLFGRAL